MHRRFARLVAGSVARPTLIFVAVATLGTATRGQAQAWGQYGVTVQQFPITFGVGGVNNFGQVAGTDCAAACVASIFSNGTVQDLPPMPGASLTTGSAINNSGQVAGTSSVPGAKVAFLYDGSSMQALGGLGGVVAGISSEASGINSSGEVVGLSYTTAGNYDAFLYSRGTMHDLGTLGGADSRAYAINDAGEVVGYSDPSGSTTPDPFLYNNGVMQDLGSLGGGYGYAYGINNSGEVVGASASLTGVDAFLYTASGGMQSLGTLPGGILSEAFGISDPGDAVGTSLTATGTFLAAIWESNGSGSTAYSLSNIVNSEGNSGWLFTNAVSISDNGEYILAQGSDNGGAVEDVLLQADAPVTATPEPASLVLLATGLVALAGAARRRMGGQAS